MTSMLRALSYRFTVVTGDPVLGRASDELFTGLRDEGAPEHRYTLTVRHDDGGADAVDVHRDDALVARCPDAHAALGWLVWEVNRAAAAASGEHLLFHAGALQVRRDGVGLMLPGTSGSGKSTLSEWLARAGLPYLSDELVALDLGTGLLLPYPKPITRKPEGDDRSERHVPIGAGVGHVGAPCLPAFIVFPRYVPGAPTTLLPLRETEAFLELAANAVNFADHGDAAAAALGSLVAHCTCARLIASDVEEAGRQVLELVGARSAAVAGSPRHIEADHARAV